MFGIQATKTRGFRYYQKKESPSHKYQWLTMWGYSKPYPKNELSFSGLLHSLV